MPESESENEITLESIVGTALKTSQESIVQSFFIPDLHMYKFCGDGPWKLKKKCKIRLRNPFSLKKTSRNPKVVYFRLKDSHFIWLGK